jgi:serine/threonine-protein kinase
MHDTAQDDDRLMMLVDLALARPAGERERYLRDECGGDQKLFENVWQYVQWEERMKGFLQEAATLTILEDHPFAPGEVLEHRFRILRELAQGGMGVVYEAVDEKLDRRIALKCAKTGFGKRLPPEARHATAVSHPNVCKIFEIHTASTARGPIDFLTMEFLDGETLSLRLAKGALPEAEAREIAAQLCAGLGEAHRNRVVHGDLKCNNVILTTTADGAARAVITDFGLARQPDVTGLLHVGVSGGTPDYMAPELRRGDKPTVASDLYALGIMLHELIAGRKPEGGRIAEGLPKRWRSVIGRCLDPDPARRFASAPEVSKALAPVSRRWLIASAAALALAVASGVIGYERATEHQEVVRLAVLPLDADGDAGPLAASISRSAAAEIGGLRGGRRTRLVIAKGGAEVTHVMHGAVRREGGAVVVHAMVTDARTQANADEREFHYLPGEVRYAGAALAGMTRSALHLDGRTASVNDAAKRDYEAGLAFTRRNSTVERALPLLQRAVEEDPDSPLTWAALAEAQWFLYFLQQDRAWLERVQESVRQAEKRDPDAAAVHRVAGLLRGNAGQHEQAEAEYLRAIEVDPSNGDAYRRLGHTYERTNRLEPALTAYRQAMEREPGNFKVYQDLGTYYSSRGDAAQAILHLEKCVQLAPDEPDSHYGLGSAYLNAGRFAEAEREFRASIALGETPRALNNLAATLVYQGKDREAIPELLRAIERVPNRYLLWQNLGDAYRRTGSAREASRAYRRGLDLAEQEMARDARDGAVRARVGYLCARLGDRKRAETETAQALQLSPQSPDVRQGAVWTYEALGRRDDALAVLKGSSEPVVASAVRGVDLADLRQDPRFQQWRQQKQVAKESAR